MMDDDEDDDEDDDDDDDDDEQGLTKAHEDARKEVAGVRCYLIS